jgi:hypothetical protein
MTREELGALSAALHDDDPVVAYFAANSVASLLEVGAGPRYGSAFLAVTASAEQSARLGRIDAVFECLENGWCDHSQRDAGLVFWWMPKDEAEARLQRSYAEAVSRGRPLEEILKLR